MISAERFARVKTIFLAASALPRGDRTRFVAAECGDDTELSVHVRRMLDDDRPEAAFLETPALPDRPVPDGSHLGHFRIIRILGEGGMGVVYEAEQDEPSRRVALKVIRAGILYERLRSRFRHEIRVLGQLRHPGIAQIYEAGTFEIGGEAVPYFAMELVDGRPLLACAAESGLGVRERLVLIAQVCDAVHHAHQKGVIHRDLKPGNILVESASTSDSASASRTALPLQVKVLDFGIARATDTDLRTVTIRTEPGQLVGTVPYMSPEQVAGQPDAIDIRSDVYSIGVIAFELLAGRLPYPVRDRILPEAVRLIHEAEPTRLGSIDRTLRGDIETIIGKALDKDRQHRYQSAAELAADIRRYLRDEPIVARPASALYQLRKFARRHRPLVIAAVLVVLAMAVATAVSLWQARVAENARSRAEGEKTRADAAADAARREARRATLSGAAAAIASRDPITATRLLDGAQDRGWAWRYWRARLDECVAVAHAPGPIVTAWLSPDGREVAAVSAQGAVYRGPAWSGELTEVSRLAEAPALAVFADQGRRIVTQSPDRVTVFDAATGSVIRRHESAETSAGLLATSADASVVLAGPRRPGRSPADVLWQLRAGQSNEWTASRVSIPAGAFCAAVSADGRWIALGGGRSGVMTWDTAAPEPREFARPARAVQAIAITDDGSLIATGGVDKAIGIWDRATGAQLLSLAGHTGAVTALAFDPAGRTLASAGVDLTIHLWDVAGGRAITTFVGQTGSVRQLRYIGHTGPVQRLQFSADGTVLMSASEDGIIRLWRRDPFEGTCVLRGHTSYVYSVLFTPDGSRILSGAWDGTVRAWNAADGAPLGETPCDQEYITALGRSADGRLIAAGHKTDGVRRVSSVVIWDAANMRPIHTVGMLQGEVTDLIFSADGSRLYVCRESRGLDELDLSASPPQRRGLANGSAPCSIALSSDGRLIACGMVNGSIALVGIASGGIERTFEGHRQQIRNIAFHPARPLLASASDDGTARLWDLRTGRTVELAGHADKVYCVAFSPDGRTLATGSEDTTIVIWDIEDAGARAEELTRLRGHDAYIYSLAFSPDGSTLVSGSGDHTVRIWDTRPVHQRWMAR